MLCLDGQLYKHVDTRFLTFSVTFCVFLSGRHLTKTLTSLLHNNTAQHHYYIWPSVDKEIVNKIGKHVTKVPVSGKNKSGSTVLKLKLSHKYCSCFKTRVSQLMLMIISH